MRNFSRKNKELKKEIDNIKEKKKKLENQSGDPVTD